MKRLLLCAIVAFCVAASAQTHTFCALDQTCAYTGTGDYSGATLLKARVAAALTTTVNGDFGYDSTNLNWHFFGNGVDNINVIVPASVSITNSDCANWSKSGNVVTLNDAGSPCALNKGGAATVANGTPAIVAKADQTAQQANIGSTTLYAVPASGAGMYRVSCYLVVTQAATNTSTLPSCQISFTDNDTSVAGLGPYTITGTNTGNSLGASNSIPALPAAESAVLNAKASTNITYDTTGYASNGATPMQYAIHVKLEYLGN